MGPLTVSEGMSALGQKRTFHQQLLTYTGLISVLRFSLYQLGGWTLMRGFAVLLAYVVGLSAVFSIGIMGLMALKPSTNSTPSAATASHKERLAKPFKQTTTMQKDAQPIQKRKTVQTRRRKEEAPTMAPWGNAYGYAQEPRRSYQYPSFFFR